VVAGEAIRDGHLTRVLEDSHHIEPLPLNVVWSQGRHRSPKVAAMVEFLVEKFSGAPWRARP
jgi:DNA-binding transcriptional LysR family regulator